MKTFKEFKQEQVLQEFHPFQARQVGEYTLLGFMSSLLSGHIIGASMYAYYKVHAKKYNLENIESKCKNDAWPELCNIDTRIDQVKADLNFLEKKLLKDKTLIDKIKKKMFEKLVKAKIKVQRDFLAKLLKEKKEVMNNDPADYSGEFDDPQSIAYGQQYNYNRKRFDKSREKYFSQKYAKPEKRRYAGY